MYHPEFRYLITEDNDNRELMMPFVDGYVFAAIIVSVLSLLIVVCGLIPLFKIISLILIQLSHLLEYLWTICWNQLTPGNQWIEIAFIITSIVAFSVLIRTMEGVSKQLDSSFTKLKTEIAERNEKIAKLELEIVRLKESIQATATKKVVESEELTQRKDVFKAYTNPDAKAYDTEVDKQILATWFENCVAI